MPKTGLRAKRRFLRFPRKTQPPVTGKTSISGICPQNTALGYGQNVDFWDLPVKHSPRLRAKRRFLRFARKTQSSVTGKTSISGICPQMLDPVPPKVDKKRAFYRILSTTDSKSGSRDATSRQKQRLSLNFCLPPTQNPAPAPTEPQAEQTILSTFLRPMQCDNIAAACSAFLMQKKSGISASSAKIPH